MKRKRTRWGDDPPTEVSPALRAMLFAELDRAEQELIRRAEELDLAEAEYKMRKARQDALAEYVEKVQTIEAEYGPLPDRVEPIGAAGGEEAG